MERGAKGDLHTDHDNFRYRLLEQVVRDNRTARINIVFENMPDGDFIQPVLAGLDQAGFSGWQRFIAQFLPLEWHNHLLGFKLFTHARDNDGHPGRQSGIQWRVNPVGRGKAYLGRVECLLDRTAGGERDRLAGAIGGHAGSDDWSAALARRRRSEKPGIIPGENEPACANQLSWPGFLGGLCG